MTKEQTIISESEMIEIPPSLVASSPMVLMRTGQYEVLSEELIAKIFFSSQSPEQLMHHPLVKDLVEALRTVIDQPFKGSWDAQAVYCQKALAPFGELDG